jgi:hypothetical protein
MKMSSFSLVKNLPNEEVSKSMMSEREREAAASAAASRRQARDLAAFPAFYNAEDELDALPEFNKVKLNPTAKAFLPEYDPLMSMRDLLVLMGGETIPSHLLLSKGYPAHWVHKLEKNEERETPTLKWGTRGNADVFESDQVNRSVGGSFRNSFNQGEVASDWHAYATRPTPRSVRPSVYSPAAYRHWANGEITHFNGFVHTKRRYVSGNYAARLLYYGNLHVTPKVVSQLLASAAFFVADYKDSQLRTPKGIYLSDFIPKAALPPPPKFLSIMGQEIHNLEDWKRLDHFNSKTKLIQKLGVRFFQGDEAIDQEKLQSMIEEHFVQKQALFGVDHRISFDLQGFANALTDAFDDENKTRSALNLAAAVMAIYYAESWQSAIAAVFQFATGNPTVYRYASRFVRNLTRPEVELQGDSWVSGFTQETLRPFWDATVGTLISFVVDEVFPTISGCLTPLIKDLLKGWRFAMIKFTSEDLAKNALAAIKDIVGRIRSAIATRSFAPLWGRKWNPKTFVREVDAMVQYHVTLIVSSGAAPGPRILIRELVEKELLGHEWLEPVCRADFIGRARLLLAHGDEMRTYFATDPIIAQSIARSTKALLDLVAHMEVHGASQQARRVPFGILFYGLPGTGKTYLASQVSRAIANRNGYPSSDGIYQFQPGANFQDGLESHTFAIQMDDVDQTVAPAASGVRNHIEWVNAIQNNAPLPVEQARVEDKGKVFAAPVLLTICTNFANMRAHQFSLCPETFYRRLNIHATVTVKEEFAQADGKINTAKALASLTYDHYNIAVREPHIGSGPLEQRDPVMMGLPEFIAFVHAKYDEHHASQTAIVADLMAKGASCASCGFVYNPQGFCACAKPKEKLQGLHGFFPHSWQNPFWQLYMGLLIASAMYQILVTDRVLYDGPGELIPGHLLPGVPPRPRTIDGPLTFDEQFYNYCRGIYPNSFYATVRCFFRYYGKLARYRAMDNAVEGFRPSTKVAAAAVAGFLIYAWALSHMLEYVFQGREANSTGILPKDWTRAEQKFVPGIPPPSKATYTIGDLEQAVVLSHLTVMGSGGQMQGFALGGNCMLVPSHVGKFGESISVTCQGVSFNIQITNFNTATLPSNDELMVVICPRLKPGPGILGKMAHIVDESIMSYDEVRLYGPGLEHTATTNSIMSHKTSKILTTNIPTVNGDCGKLYVCRHNQSWRITGMHYMLLNSRNGFGYTTSYTGAGLVTRMEIEAICKTIQGFSKPAHVLQSSMIPEGVVTMGPYSHKSEIWAAQTDPGAVVYPLGHMTPEQSGATPKSKLLPTRFQELVVPFADEVCGTKNYWQIPDFRGQMVDGVWTSSYTDAFVTQNTKEPQPDFLALAVLDYLSGMEDLDRSGYAVLSEEQVLSGVRGSTIHEVNKNTSCGPPFNCTKRKMMYVEKDNSVMSPLMWTRVDEIETALVDGSVPIPHGKVTLKDEPVKPGKMPRPFIVLPFSYNFVAKKYGAWQAFIRANFAFFESAVGINMTSNEAGKLIAHLAQVNPSLDRLYAADARRMDKSESAPLLDAVALVIRCIAMAIGVGAEESETMMHGLKYTIYSVKGDLFMVLSWNPSGCQITVEINGFITSIGMRYAYYKTYGFEGDWAEVLSTYTTLHLNPLVPVLKGFTFRENFRLIHYGDDNLFSSRLAIPPSFFTLWKDELGIEMLPTSKVAGGVVEPGGIEDIDFLKRTFVYDEFLGCWKTPLSLKSIARMLMFKRDSALSEADHAAAIVTDVAREAFYHEPETRERLRVLCWRIIQFMGIEKNPYLLWETIEEMETKARAGEFQTWDTHNAPEPERLEGEVVLQSYYQPAEGFKFGNQQTTMSNLHLVEGANDAPNDSQSATTSLQFGTMHLSSSATIVEATSSDAPVFTQRIPHHPLGEFLLRATKVGSFDLISTDLSKSVVFDFNPWALWMANLAVADKLKNYRLIRGSIQVTLRIAASGTSYGYYVATALPRLTEMTGAMPRLSDDVHFPNVRQTDFNAEIDVAKSNTVSLTLPWLYPYDYADTSEFMQPWRVQVTCMQAIATSIPAGFAKASVAVYVNLTDDHELAIPVYQAKAHDKKPSEFLNQVSDVAGALTRIPVIGSFAATVQQGTAAAASVAGALGFTRANAEAAPLSVTTASTSNVATTDCADPSRSAAMTEANAISIDPTLAGGPPEDQLSYDSLFSRWTLVSTIPWDVGAEGRLGSVPVTPFYGMRGSAPNHLHLTTAGFVGLPFDWWRGDMEYEIVIPRSATHRGSVQVVWNPTNSLLVPNNVTNTSINTVIDVSEAGKTTFTVGFARHKPYLRSVLTSPAVLVPNVQSYNGTLVFMVMNPLVAQTNAANTSIFVYARAKRMSFAFPRSQLSFSNAAGSELQVYDLSNGEISLQGKVEEIVYQGLAIGDDGLMETNDVPMVEESGEFPGSELFFGEEIASVRALLQKPSLIGCFFGGIRFPMFGTLPGANVGIVRMPWTWQNWYLSLFAGCAASERFKLFPATDAWLGGSPFLYGTNPAIGRASTLAPMTFCGPNKGAEFRIPYYTAQKFRPARQFQTDSDTTTYLLGTKVNRLVAFDSQGLATNTRYMLYHSLGSDIRMSRFCQVPIMVGLTAATSPAPWFEAGPP